MNLCASLVVRNELGRFLKPCIDHLLAFCDKVVVLDDASDDGTFEWLVAELDQRANIHSMGIANFFKHEGRTRQRLIDLTLAQKPTHVLSIDGDEFVSDGALLRSRIEAEPNVPVWSLDMLEVWRADADGLAVRIDGGWRPHPLSVVWRAPQHGETFRMLDRKLACRRVPMQVLSQNAKTSGAEILHFGWTDKATRQSRYFRYAKHDGGRYHASAHLKSILWNDARVSLRKRSWPEGPVFDSLRDRFSEVTVLRGR